MRKIMKTSKHMLNLKVIACAFNPERHIRRTSKYPDHNQGISSWEDHQKMFEKILEYERTYNAGVPMDTLIVMNGDCKGFFTAYDGIDTPNGKIIVRQRENIGGSFGAYSYAYENFKYDTYLFTEDDLFVFGDEYYKKILEKMESEEAHFVALIGISENPCFPLHAHGGVGVAKRSTLDNIAENGELPYHHDEWHRSAVITFGEIPFTNNIVNADMKMIYYGKPEWNINNLLMPYYEL